MGNRIQLYVEVCPLQALTTTFGAGFFPVQLNLVRQANRRRRVIERLIASLQERLSLLLEITLPHERKLAVEIIARKCRSSIDFLTRANVTYCTPI